MSTHTVTIESPQKLVVLTSDEYEGLMETLDIMSDPEAMKRIKKADENFKKGKFITLEQLEKKLNIRQP